MKKNIKEAVLEGYRHLAFGDISGPVKLLFAEKITPQMLKKMDLFRVSEIKSVKGGGMEIKFYDRFEALKLMLELDDQDDGDGFLRALEQGAAALREANAAKEEGACE